MKKRLGLILMLSTFALLLAGCTEFNEPIYEDSEGFWNKYIVWPLVSLITLFKELLGTYGYGIVAVTIIIRLILLPLMIKQTKSSKEMQEIQPELNALKEKYKSKDAVTQEKYRTEMQKLMTERKINPAAGCLPVLIQMPILIGFYHAISRMNSTPEIELGTFLWFQLADRSITLALIAGIMQFIVLRTGPAMGNPQMRMMMYIMPVFIIVIGTILPAALSLYWVIGNIISIIQNFFIYKPFKKEEEPVKQPAKVGGKRK
ncbi:membrane protein insertase YidC [Sporosarcina pasteurii]|uniref:Membrane protein insertase YidC n=1 Tax=Sporosarcina pasteurii TaxID=1474 RepID=A0A380CJX7_SPOPA|nr:membrane protein insertase YidC [Sporosarcina pasteurii]MDS9471832.1 membrane protein insertase YidC [Sporosarcina pasteurii]QBQ06571.1 membrane protein insertase YidC [Sporosarcina pasteurii]SUJ22032.1 Stage III sporulation protein J [Sporosarcina pasteurii]